MATKSKKSESEIVSQKVRELQKELGKVEDDARERDVTGPAEHIKRANRELERALEYDREESPND